MSAVSNYTPAEFQELVERKVHELFTPSEFQAMRQKFEADGMDPLKEAARNNLPGDLDDREAYVDAMSTAIANELGVTDE